MTPELILSGAVGVLWAIIAAKFFPAIIGGFKRSGNSLESMKAFICAVAFLNLFFLARRVILKDYLHHDPQLIALYTMSLLVALWGVLMVRAHDP